MTTTNTEGLKPCPFCSGTEIFIEPDEFGSGGQWVPPIYVGCADCQCQQLGCDKQEAISAWNLRPTEQASESIRRAALEEAAVICETAPDYLQDSTFDGAAKAIRALSTTPAEPVQTPDQIDYRAEIARLVEMNDKLRANENRLIDELYKARHADCATTPSAQEGQSAITVPLDGCWYWVLKENMDRQWAWHPAQRERNHWNSAKFSGIPLHEVVVGPEIASPTQSMKDE